MKTLIEQNTGNSGDLVNVMRQSAGEVLKKVKAYYFPKIKRTGSNAELSLAQDHPEKRSIFSEEGNYRYTLYPRKEKTSFIGDQLREMKRLADGLPVSEEKITAQFPHEPGKSYTIRLTQPTKNTSVLVLETSTEKRYITEKGTTSSLKDTSSVYIIDANNESSIKVLQTSETYINRPFGQKESSVTEKVETISPKVNDGPAKKESKFVSTVLQEISQSLLKVYTAIRGDAIPGE